MIIDVVTKRHHNKNADIEFSVHDTLSDISGITIIRYAQNLKIGKPYNLEF